MRQLRGRTALVTGAASGIGRSIAERFLLEGMRTVLVDRDPTLLKSTATALSALGTEWMTCVMDVSQADQFEDVVRQVVERFGALHVVCNNAGILGRRAPSWELEADEWRQVMDVNFVGVVNGIRATLPLLLQQEEGHVVNTASAAGWASRPGLAPYSASKHAVVGLSEALLLELEDLGGHVGVSVLCPQVVRTRIADDVEETDGERQQALVNAIRAGRAPEDVAHALVEGMRARRFLISEDPEAIVKAADARALVARGATPRYDA